MAPYLSHEMPGHMLSSLYFAPFEDVLGIGHDRGLSSILVPGAGQANVDTLELNPFETTRQRQESEVKMLLEKVKIQRINDKRLDSFECPDPRKLETPSLLYIVLVTTGDDWTRCQFYR